MRHPHVIIAATLSSLLMVPAFAQSPPSASQNASPPAASQNASPPGQDPLGAAYVRNMQGQVGQALSELALKGAQVEVLQGALTAANERIAKLQAELDASKKKEASAVDPALTGPGSLTTSPASGQASPAPDHAKAVGERSHNQKQ